MKISEKTYQGFIEQCQSGESFSECCLWDGYSRNGRYGDVWVDGGWVKAHRHTYSLVVSEIPEGAVICHKCDTPMCINPAHLFAGTQADNLRDARNKGRRPVAKPKSVISAKSADAIRRSRLSSSYWAKKLKVKVRDVEVVRQTHTAP